MSFTSSIRMNPECRAKKHGNCNGDGWDEGRDTPCQCPCNCHTPDRTPHYLRYAGETPEANKQE